MTATVTPSDSPAYSSGRDPAGPGSTANYATRHLCAVTHMRTSMLAAGSLEADGLLPAPRRWVGRLYALHVLADPQFGPMPGIDLGVVKRHCWQVIRQTLARDVIALGVVVAAFWLAPWSTVLLLGFVAVVIALAGRVKLSSPFVLAAVVGIIIALVTGGPAGNDPFAFPLLAVAACFLIYLADTFVAIRRMRAVFRPGFPRARRSRRKAGPGHPPAFDSPDEFATLLSAGPADLTGPANGYELGTNGHGLAMNGHAPVLTALRTRRRDTALYAIDGILGAGTPRSVATITVAVNKPQKDQQIRPFTASELLEQIASHIESQGTVDHTRDGFAHSHVVIDGQRIPLDIPAPGHNGDGTADGVHQDRSESFTYGLPELDVSEVVATPVKGISRHPFWWKVTVYVGAATWRRLRRASLALQETGDIPAPSQSPSAFPNRFYVRASTTTWDGELIASVYVGAALQGHYLRLIIRPYVLAPIAPQLRRVESLMDRSVFIQFALALKGTVLAFARTAVAAHKVSHKQRPKKKRPKETGLLSTRERYAMYQPNDIHHHEDVNRILDIMEMKVFEVVEDFLDQHHVNLEDFQKQAQIFIEKSMVITGGQNSGNFSAGDNNSQQNSSGGSSTGQGSGK